MKKIFLFAAAAALLTACSTEELSNVEVAQQNNAETPVDFSIYTPRSVTRAGAPGEITTASLQSGAHSTYGFGVFGYYTNAGNYSETSTPNFMYNQQVVYNSGEWKYEPVKYWPNEYGNAAVSDDVDRLTFFAYAPWTNVTPSTGVPIKLGGVSVDEKNITSVTKNTATGDPIVKYVVDTDGTTSVDLLWGVYAGQSDYTTTWGSATATVKSGMPFLNIMKPNNPETSAYTDWTTTGYSDNKDNKVRFNLCHALSKLLVTIDYFDDGTAFNAVGDLEASKQTKIWVREVKIGGFMMKGALNLNNTDRKEIDPDGTPSTGDEYYIGVPNWKAYDGVSELEYEETIFKDGRKDGREGTPDGDAANEKYLGLNPTLIQGAQLNTALPTEYQTEVDVNGNTVITTAWDADNKGVTVAEQPLFGTWDDTNKKWIANTTASDIFVIPMNKPIDVSIVYDVETINPKLAGKLSDNLTPGKTIENKIYKLSSDIFGSVTNMEAGKYYVLKLHLGMTSVKVDASVQPWTDQDGSAKLPENN